MLNIEEVTRLLVNHAIKVGGHDLELICIYGSRTRGDAREDSDLDIFYVPAEGSNPPIARTFTLDGLLFDFWAIHWPTLEGFATGYIRGWAFAPGLVHQAKVIYSNSETATQRLEGLKQQIENLQKPEAKPQMIQRALATFSSVQAHLANLEIVASKGDETDVRYAARKVVGQVWECLALVNQVFFEKGLKKSLGDLGRFKERPTTLEESIRTLLTSFNLTQVLNTGRQLAQDTREILRQSQRGIPSNQVAIDLFRHGYPELRDMVTKLFSTCEQGDTVGASIQAHFLQSELVSLLNQTVAGATYDDFNAYGEMCTTYRELGFPDLIKLASGPLVELSRQVQVFDDKLRSYLQGQSIDLCEFKTLDDLKKDLSQ
jgi:predicted nucleotidyltransferase